MTRAIRYQRSPAASTHLVDGDVFLVTRKTIKHLNATAAVIWMTLEDPATRRDMLDILREVFVSIEPRQLARDLDRFLRGAIAERLIIREPHRSAENAAK